MDGHFTTLWTGAKDIPYEDASTADIEGVDVPTAVARRIVARSRTVYRSDDMTRLLPSGVAESHGLPGQSFRLALTPGQIGRVFGTRVTEPILLEGGYVRLPDQNDWWMPSGRVFYSPGDNDAPALELGTARDHFYQPRRTIDPFGAISRVGYDQYDLLSLDTTDALGNVTAASIDYRVLHPVRVTDPNGNFSEIAFDCLGQLVGTAVGGRAGEGDSLAGFDRDLTDEVIQATREAPLGDPGNILGGATSRLVYDLFAYFRTRDLPAPDSPLLYTLTRETHVSDLSIGQVTRFHHALAYSDGFGRIAQHKMQAEAGPVAGAGGVVSPRWVGSGWTIFNNKGKPVRTYEPFFSQTHRFEFNRQAGVSSVTFYDCAERSVAAVHPDNTFEKTVFDSWRQETWDANDTALVGDPRADADVGDWFRRLFGVAPGAFVSWHDRRAGGTLGATPAERSANQDAAAKAAAHAATPAVTHFDSLGRTCLGIADNGRDNNLPQRFATRTALDPEGKPLAVFDALGRRVMEFCVREPSPGGGFRYVAGYDMAGTALYRNGMDGGERRTLNNVAGNSVRHWNARGFVFRVRYDALHRPTHRFVGRGGISEILTERSVFGEQHPAAERNLKGRLFRQYDGSGVASSDRYDFKGNVLESARHMARHAPPAQFPADYRQRPDWTPIAEIAESPALDVATLDAASAPLLVTADRFSASSRFDAMNRPVQMVAPHRATAPSNRPSVVQPVYSEANLLEKIDVWIRQADAPTGLLSPDTADIHAVTNIDYNARGQRARLALGNGAVSTYLYDPETFRLTTLTTTRPNPDPDARTVQDLAYTYDSVGNITALRDTADIQNVVYFRNQRVEPSAAYTYDALYRLRIATGREHLGQSTGVLNPAQQVTNDDSARVLVDARGDGNAMAAYTEQYSYDPVGNFETMIHQVASGSWARRYSYREASDIAAGETSNRLSATSLPGDNAQGPFSATYAYDDHGNMVRMPHLPTMIWDEHDRLLSTTRQAVNAGVPETTYYSVRRRRGTTSQDNGPRGCCERGPSSQVGTPVSRRFRDLPRVRSGWNHGNQRA